MGPVRRPHVTRAILATVLCALPIAAAAGREQHAADPATALPPRGLVADNQSPFNKVVLFDPIAKATTGSVDVGGDNVWVGVSPDGATAYAQVVYPSARFSVLGLTGTPGERDSRASDGNLSFGAMAPDGRTAYLSGGGKLQPVDVTTSPPTLGTAVPVPSAGDVAITPDGRRAYVGSGASVTPVDLATGTAGAAVPTGAGAFGVAASPDGTTVWVANRDARTVSAVPTAGGAAVPVDLAAVGHPVQLAVSPAGDRVYVALGTEHRLAWIDTATRTVGGSIDLGTDRAFAVAVSPDGRTVFVSDGSFNGTGAGTKVVPVDVTTDPPVAGTAMTGYVDPVWIALTPDQPPTASFAVGAGRAGSPTSFDASASLPGSTPTVRYDWDFGDGATATTTTPATTHVYGADGTYEAKLTLTDAAGTSTTRVFTGQQVLRNGGPSATATRSVVVAAGPRPQVALSTGQLDFGTAGVGHPTGPQGVTVTNTGDGPLHIGGTALGGAGAAQYAVTADGCAGATVAPGATCSLAVAFAPSAAGPAPASLAVTDDASGSPHTVLLTGVATDRASIRGTVRDGSAGGLPGLAGARLSVCPFGTVAGCQVTTTEADGSYAVGGLAPGRYAVEVLPPGGRDLSAGSAVVSVAVADQARRDFRLDEPDGLSATLTVNGQTGGGPPTTFWRSPTDVRSPLIVPDGRPGEFGMTEVSFYTGPGGGTGVDGQAAASFTVVYAYDDDAVPRFVASIERRPGATARPAQAGTTPLAPSVGTWTLGVLGAVAPGADLRRAEVSGVLSPLAGTPFHGASRISVQQRRARFGFQSPSAGAGEPPIFPGPVLPDWLPGPKDRTPPDSAKDAARAARDYADKEYGRGDFSRQTAPPKGATEPALPPSSCPDDGTGKPPRPAKKPKYLGNGKSRMSNDEVLDSRRRTVDIGKGYTIDLENGDIVAKDGSRYHLQDGRITTPEGSRFFDDAIPRTYNPDGTVDALGYRYDPSNGNVVSLDRNGNTVSGYTTDGRGIDFTNDTGYGPDGPIAVPRVALRRAGAGRDRAHAAQSGCDPAGDDNRTPNDGGGYVDPSGEVVTTAGAPVPRAKVTLLAAPSPGDGFQAVPRGSAIMSPANRRNPDRTDALGHFGWDVVAGLYRVTARHGGCRGTARTKALVIPPPVTDLRLKLRCPSLQRASGRVALAVLRVPVGRVQLRARVRSRDRRHRPQGVVTFRRRGRVLAAAPVDRRTGLAVVTLTTKARAGITARYGGDGYTRPATGR